MDIRFADKNDIPVIQKLAYQIWPEAYKFILSEKQITYMLNLYYSTFALEEQFQKQQFILAVTNDQPVGFAAFSSSTSNDYYLHKLYVLTGEQNKGNGKALLQFIINYIHNKKGTSLVLQVNRFNKAISFYQKQGFTIIKEEDIDIGEGWWMNDFQMKKIL